MRRPAARGGPERGAVALEFAIGLPVFVMLAFGAWQFGIAHYNSMIVHAAAVEGARAGALCEEASCAATATAQAENVLRLGFLGGAARTVTYSEEARGGGAYTVARMRISAPRRFRVPLMGDFSISHEASSEARKESDRR